jgi:hypothetical protein
MKGAWTIHAAQRPFPVLSRIGSPRFSFKWTASFMCPFFLLIGTSRSICLFKQDTTESKLFLYLNSK